MASKNDEMSLWTVGKIVLMTAGAIYLVSLVTWFAHWTTMLAALGGAAYVAWTVSKAFARPQAAPKQLSHESAADLRLRQLEAEERVLDRRIGL